MFTTNVTKINVNPSNLIAPVKMNERIFNSLNKQATEKHTTTTYDNEEYNFRSDESINNFYKSNDRLLKKYKSRYEFDDDNVYQEKSLIRGLLPRIFYRKYAKNE